MTVLVVLANVQLGLDDGAESAPVARSVFFAILERNVVAGEKGDGEVQRVLGGVVQRHAGLVGALVRRGLEDPAVLAGEHGLVEHHALVHVLPVHGHHLHASSPKEARVRVGAVDPSAGRKGPHEEVLVVRKDLARELVVQLQDSVLADGEDVGGLLRLRGAEALEPLAAGVDGQVAQGLAYRHLAVLILLREGPGGRRSGCSESRDALIVRGRAVVFCLQNGQGSSDVVRAVDLGDCALDFDHDFAPEVIQRGYSELGIAALIRLLDKHISPDLLHDCRHDLLLVVIRVDLQADNDG